MLKDESCNATTGQICSMDASVGLICRACLTVIRYPNKATSVHQPAKNLNTQILIKDVIERCIPEMDLDISSSSAVICHSCHEALVNAYVFKSKCYETEERIFTYMEKNNLNMGDKIDLRDLLKGSNEEIPSKSDVDSDTAPEQAESFGSLSGGEEDYHMVNDEKSGGIRSSCDPHVNSGNSYSCARCNYCTYKKVNLQEHVHYFCLNKSLPRTYKCDHCTYKTFRKNYMTSHMMKRHGMNGPYSCGICHRTFGCKSSMRLHILYKHSVLEDVVPFRCRLDNCQEVFKRKSDFNFHVVTHATYNPFICQLCKKGFFDGEQWDKHMERVHELCS
ncbi:hypothetical protein NQ315_015790 [Exocentrus adspersus]|uniref:Uncharacterized protein n=1 Tax=Exocentrus adspersus TaxID=1586481 RepID=A0AAV8W3D3_9CUCU|nr:hypothetical protein NQ315_015790 [Exocentrus adspersus]